MGKKTGEVIVRFIELEGKLLEVQGNHVTLTDFLDHLVPLCQLPLMGVKLNGDRLTSIYHPSILEKAGWVLNLSQLVEKSMNHLEE